MEGEVANAWTPNSCGGFLMQQPHKDKDQGALAADVGLPTSLLEAKLHALSEAIQELEAEIAAREVLNRAFLEGISKEKERVQDLLAHLGHPWSKGYLPAWEELRASLVREASNLANRERSERLKMWEDIVSLKKQRRVYLIEYQALRKTAELLEEPVDGD